MNSSFAASTSFTKEEEGSYVDDPRDSGNWSSGVCNEGRLIGSNLGVGAPALISWLGPHVLVTAETMRDLSAQTYSAIARARYWRAMSCDLLPDGVDLCVFDFGWNRGDGMSVRILQRVVGVEEDGDCGPETLSAVGRYGALADLVDSLTEEQMADYEQLVNFSIYGRGWEARTLRRQAAALALIPAA